MTNPYESSIGRLNDIPSRKFVQRYVWAGLACTVLSCIVGMPAAILLNQNWQWIPTRTFVSSIEFNGETIENNTIMAHSLTYAIVLFVLAIILLGISFWNSFAISKRFDSA